MNSNSDTAHPKYVNLYRSTKRRASSARRFLASRVASVMCWCPIAPLLAASLALLATCAISLRASDAEGLTRWERGSALRAKQIGRCCVASGGLCTFAPIHRVSLAWSDFLPALCLCDVCQSLVGPIEICCSLPCPFSASVWPVSFLRYSQRSPVSGQYFSTF